MVLIRDWFLCVIDLFACEKEGGGGGGGGVLVWRYDFDFDYAFGHLGICSVGMEWGFVMHRYEGDFWQVGFLAAEMGYEYLAVQD